MTTQQRAERPKELEHSVTLWFITMALSLIGAAVRVFTLPASVLGQIREQAQREGFGGDQRMLHDTMLISQIIAIVLYAGLCVVWAVFVLRMRRGRRWARTVLAVLGWLSLVLTFPLMISDQFATILFYGATAVVELSAIVLMFRAPSNEYFATTDPRS